MTSKEQTRFYSEHLQKVSRSFAFCIEELEQPLRHWIGLAYILCRIADTIEDSTWPSSQEQSKAFGVFVQALDEPNVVNETWFQTFPATIPGGELELLKCAPRFFSDLHALEDSPRKILQKSIREMAQGMEFFCLNKTQNGQLRLESLIETNQYCFFVAGLVGELLTGVATLEIPQFDRSKENLLAAFHFGLYLQKINLLKDQFGDEVEGRFFVSSRNDLLASLLVNARHALDYILRLPIEARSYRIFCAWSFYLGLASLPWIEKSWKKKTAMKISRLETWALLKEIKSQIDDNQYLQRTYEKLTKSLRKDHWYQDIYNGPLTITDFEQLGMS